MNNSRSSHTLLQVAQGNAESKTCKRVCPPQHATKMTEKPTTKKNTEPITACMWH